MTSQVDVSAAFAYTSAPKDDTEVSLLRKACQHTCAIFSKFVKHEIVTIVDDEKRVKHSKLADDIEVAITEGKFLPSGMEGDSVRGRGWREEEGEEGEWGREREEGVERRESSTPVGR